MSTRAARPAFLVGVFFLVLVGGLVAASGWQSPAKVVEGTDVCICTSLQPEITTLPNPRIDGDIPDVNRKANNKEVLQARWHKIRAVGGTPPVDLYYINLVIPYRITLVCTGLGTKCTGNLKVSAESADWKV